jgi:hypothetical protein
VTAVRTNSSPVHHLTAVPINSHADNMSLINHTASLVTGSVTKLSTASMEQMRDQNRAVSIFGFVIFEIKKGERKSKVACSFK